MSAEHCFYFQSTWSPAAGWHFSTHCQGAGIGQVRGFRQPMLGLQHKAAFLRFISQIFANAKMPEATEQHPISNGDPTISNDTYCRNHKAITAGYRKSCLLDLGADGAWHGH
jgi:hypothetical protein